LTYGDFNVFIVRWGGGSAFPYAQATANTRLVGLEVAYMLKTLVSSFGAKMSDMHLIGHSLGSHVAGYAGKNVTALGRITGLDPAGPYFEWMPAFVRLDSADAQFVDAIHTNGEPTILLGGFGMVQPIGHLDFYPNGGQNQPGCSLSSLSIINITTLTNLGGCSHMRAISLFNDSLVSTCQSVAYECSSFSAFQLGQCASCGSSNLNCSQFGMAASSYPTRSRTNVRLYFDTASTITYCEYHYQITISLAKPSGASSWVNGALYVSMTGSSGSIVKKQLTVSSNGDAITLGQNQTYLDVESLNLGTISSVSLTWNYINNPLNPLTYCGPLCNSHLYVNSVKVSEMNNYPETSRLAKTYKLCPSGVSYGSLASGSSFTFSTAC
jgi:pancreatic triacylglycerol lipase